MTPLPPRPARFLPLGVLVLTGGLGACAAGGAGAPPIPRQAASSPHYVCANGASFVLQPDPATGQMVLWIDGGAGRRLAPVPDPNGGTLFQDGAYQLRPAPFGATATLTDRSDVTAQTCSRL